MSVTAPKRPFAPIQQPPHLPGTGRGKPPSAYMRALRPDGAAGALRAARVIVAEAAAVQVTERVAVATVKRTIFSKLVAWLGAELVNPALGAAALVSDLFPSDTPIREPRIYAPTPAVDKPPMGKGVIQWIDKLDEMGKIAIEIATLQQQIRLMEEWGLGDWNFDSKERLENLVAKVQTIVQGYSPALREGMQIKASAASSSSSQSADKTWWSEKDKDQKPERGERRWYIENTPRDGARATQVQQWNGSEWRPLKLKDNPAPPALEAKLGELNSSPKPAVTVAQNATTFGSVLARPSAPPNPAYSPSSPTIVSADVIFANDTMLSKMPDGDHVIYLDRGGRIGTSGSPLTLRVGPDPDTGLRRWIVTSPVTGPLPVNFARSLEKLDGDAAQVGQVVKLLEGRSDGVLLTTHPNTGAWVQYKNWVTGWGVTGQYGYDLQRTQPDATVPPRWGVRESYVYSGGYGWEKRWSGQNVPFVLAKPLKIANDKLARAFEAGQQMFLKPAPGVAQTLVEPLSPVAPSSTAPITTLSDAEISANAAAIIQIFNASSSVDREVYIDSAGRLLADKPSSGVYFRVTLLRVEPSPDVTVDEVTAYADGQYRWDAFFEHDESLANQSDVVRGSTPAFPIDAVEKTLDAVRGKMLSKKTPSLIPTLSENDRD